MTAKREGFHSEQADDCERDLFDGMGQATMITSALLAISQRLEELIQELRRGRESSVQS